MSVKISSWVSQSRNSPEVKDGSTMTLSPFFKVATVCFVDLTCSAINGDTLDLKKPVPTPITIMAISQACCKVSGEMILRKLVEGEWKMWHIASDN